MFSLVVIKPFYLGADIVYEEHHAVWIKGCLERLLGMHERSAFHLVIPLRATHSIESSTVERVFANQDGTVNMDKDAPKLCILSQGTIICDADGGNGLHECGLDLDRVEYTHYKIGWR